MSVSRTTRVSSRYRKFTGFLLAFLAGSMLLGLTGCSSSQTQVGHVVTSHAGGTYSPAGKATSTATKVTVGLYAVNAYEIDTHANTFFFKGYLWLRWKGSVDPVSSLEFANSVEEWGLTVTNLTEKPQDLPGGYHLQQIRVQGRFFEPFALGNYPLDKQNLQITLEDTINDNSQIVYVPDTKDTTYDSTFQVPGWKVNGISVQANNHTYSNFGDTSAKSTEYSALTFSIGIHRASNLFWWKLLLPLMLVLITNWLALLLSPKYSEIRTAMPATALLTTVFLQQSSLDAIQGVSSLVLMDLIYVIAYTTIVLTFAQVIWDNHKIKDDDEEVIKAVSRVDRRSFAIQAALTVVAILVLVITHS